MRALHFDGTSVRYRTDLPTPTPASGEALIRVRTAGICQTDLEVAKGYMGFTGILGHEFVGTVEKVAPPPPSTAVSDAGVPTGASALHPAARFLGKRVTGEINCVCGKCDLCSRGLSSHCTARSVIGILKHDGAFADYLTLPLRNLHEIPDHVPDDEAVFVEPLAAAFQILRQVPFEKRTRAIVLGDGRLGQLVAQVLAGTGCTLTLVGHHEARLALAEKLCTAAAAARKSNAPFRALLERDLRATRDYDVVVDCTGRAEGFRHALSLVRPRGTIVLKTTVADPAPLHLAPVVIDEITIVGSRCGPFDQAIKALAAREILVAPLISRSVPLTQAAPFFTSDAASGTLKVLIRIQD
jgi:threonine dehydrogenase-like Zn-dependent dehydrogenase